MASTAVVKYEEHYPVLARDIKGILTTIKANTSGPIDQFDLDRIKIPAGGGTAWEIPTLEGNDVAKEVEGIIVHHKFGRGYWDKPMEDTGGGAPPTCASNDGNTGVGEPGGNCETCPLSRWGSDPKGGRGQACKQTKVLFLLRPGTVIPLLINLPPTSIKQATNFLLRLSSFERPFYTVVTKVGLQKKANAQGIDFSQATFSMAGKLDEGESAVMKTYSDAIRGVLDRVELQPDQAATDDPSA